MAQKLLASLRVDIYIKEKVLKRDRREELSSQNRWGLAFAHGEFHQVCRSRGSLRWVVGIFGSPKEKPEQRMDFDTDLWIFL